MIDKAPKRPKDANQAKALGRWDNEGGAPRPADRSRKHPHDPNQHAKLIVDIAAGAVEDKPEQPERKTNPAAVERGKLGGKNGGKARAEAVTPEKRQEIARKAAAARWKGARKKVQT
jgi:hypothetical protein